MLKGWKKNGRAFTKSEFENSWIKKSSKGFTYPQYKKQVTDKSVWLVHGNWTGTGKHHINTNSGVINESNFAKAKARVVAMAKARGQRDYDYETPSGKWIKVKVAQVRKKMDARRRTAPKRTGGDWISKETNLSSRW